MGIGGLGLMGPSFCPLICIQVLTKFLGFRWILNQIFAYTEILLFKLNELRILA